MRRKGGLGCMTWTALILVILALALFLGWRWAVANRSVGLLDSVDSIFTGRAAKLAGPFAFGEHPEQILTIHRSTNLHEGAAQPVLVFIHGGGWDAGTPVDYAFVGRNFAPEGFVVVNAGYRLGEEGKFPAMLEDGAAALRWVHDNIAGHGGNPQRIYVMGHSAGAYNAIMLTLDRQWLGREGLPADTIDGAIGLAGPYDFYPFDTDSSRFTFGEAPRPELTQPISFARGDAPPLLLATGDADMTVKPRNSKALARAMTEAGLPTRAVLFAAMNHEGSIITTARPFDRDRRVKNAVLSFLREREAALDAAAASLQVKAGIR